MTDALYRFVEVLKRLGPSAELDASLEFDFLEHHLPHDDGDVDSVRARDAGFCSGLAIGLDVDGDVVVALFILGNGRLDSRAWLEVVLNPLV
ncbi:MAG: hypothetical protein COV48_05715 [Elusimicrobia bacterium CG11_big_fil_rev_8_21_14_0_20_64_6]|nr:MAG: hypothetical protein COV48_05715 [Elusimicrobia bacterium CG11_big_fil_rev_8_21_14_0_20_64_6]